MASIIITIDSDLEEDVHALATAVEHVARLVTFQTVVRSSLTDEAAFRSDVVRAAAMLWSGADEREMSHNPEYLRGQIETIADAFGYEGVDIPREEMQAELLEVARRMNA